MKAIILAAGTASRLRPLTDQIPKCLLDVGGKTILGRALENLQVHHITNVILVTGYLEDRIRRFVRKNFPHMNVEFLTNALYASTNNIYSLWMTRDLIRGHSMLLLDSDIIFDGNIIDRLQESEQEDCLAVKTGIALGHEEIKVRVDIHGRVMEIGKDVHPENALGESIGIEKFGRKFTENLFTELDKMIQVEGKVDIFYEAAFQRIIDGGHRPFAIDTGTLACIEIDTIEDLESARGMLNRLSTR
jgi:choline kinase